MKYEISSILLMLAFLFGIASFSTTTYGGDKKQTNTGSITIQKPEEDRKEDSKEPIRQIKSDKLSCDAECKIETLIKLGITSKLSNLIVSECKEGAIDPRHCIIVASSIIINESGGGKSNACVKRFNCMGIGSGKIAYTSYEESIANWVSKYSRYWFKAKDMSFFYASSGEIPQSRYCMSESSSNSDLGCPIGKRITTNIFNKLDKLF